MDVIREAEAKSCPTMSQGVIRSALAGTSSPRQAIKARCLQCSNYARDEIAHCTVITCALWQYRPFQRREQAEQESEP